MVAAQAKATADTKASREEVLRVEKLRMAAETALSTLREERQLKEAAIVAEEQMDAARSRRRRSRKPSRRRRRRSRRDAIPCPPLIPLSPPASHPLSPRSSTFQAEVQAKQSRKSSSIEGHADEKARELGARIAYSRVARRRRRRS